MLLLQNAVEKQQIKFHMQTFERHGNQVSSYQQIKK